MNLATLLKYLPFLFQAGRTIPQIVQFVNDVKSDLEQKDEWTPEAEKAFADLLDAEEKDSAWKPE